MKVPVRAREKKGTGALILAGWANSGTGWHSQALLIFAPGTSVSGWARDLGADQLPPAQSPGQDRLATVQRPEPTALTMTRRSPVALLLALALALATPAATFYLPGVAPQDYARVLCPRPRFPPFRCLQRFVSAPTASPAVLPFCHVLLAVKPCDLLAPSASIMRSHPAYRGQVRPVRQVASLPRL